MDVLKAIDIALGMIVVYLTFALGVSAFNEALAAFFSSRAKWLRRGIDALLAPPSSRSTGESPPPSADDFFNSPFIAMLGATGGRDKRFAPSYIAPWTMLQGLLDAANQGKAEALGTLASVEAAVQRLPSGTPARAAIEGLIAQAGGDMEKFRGLVDQWFSDFGDQVRSWYRQKTQYVLVLLSAVVAVTLNLDTIHLIQHLSKDDKTRSALVVKAVDLSAKADLKQLLDNSALEAAKRGLDAARAESAPSREKIDAASRKLAEEQAKFDQAGADLIKGLTGDGLQLGWSMASLPAMDIYGWALKVVGLLLSAAAISLGAPFWFDLLRKVAAIRSVGLDLAERSTRATKTAETTN